MLARRLATILPDMTRDEALETTRIHRVAGLTGRRPAVATTRPCGASHQTIADAGREAVGALRRALLGERPECRRSALAV